jgi:hypothetical protein
MLILYRYINESNYRRNTLTNNKAQIICLTPVKNEAWILELFLRSTELWADYIIIADQGSDDESKKICKKHPKVILIENSSTYFNEPERQRLLINEARKISGKKLLITLDADEILSPDFLNDSQWRSLPFEEPGTTIYFELANLLPNKKNYWKGSYFPWGFIDDGSEHYGKLIHSRRIPGNESGKRIFLQTVKVLHYQYIDWNRMTSKHRWYMAFERIKFPKKSNVTINRMYSHMYTVNKNDLHLIPNYWINLYFDAGIDILNLFRIDKIYRWDESVLNYIKDYGIKKFKYVFIWERDFIHYLIMNNIQVKLTLLQHIFFTYLQLTKKNFRFPLLRIFDKFLTIFF